LVTNLFFGLLRISILLALFDGRPQVAGLTGGDAVTYVALTQTFIASFSLFGWSEFMRTIHRGEVATDLLRPLDLLASWAAQDAGRAAGQFVLRGLPMLVLFALLWGARMPALPPETLLSVVPAWACGFAYRFLVNCAAFWSPDAVGIGRFAWRVSDAAAPVSRLAAGGAGVDAVSFHAQHHRGAVAGPENRRGGVGSTRRADGLDRGFAGAVRLGAPAGPRAAGGGRWVGRQWVMDEG